MAHPGIWQKELAPAFGISPSAMSQATRPIRDLLAAAPLPPQAPPLANPARTLGELAAYAARHGIPIPGHPIPGHLPAGPTPPQHATLDTPDTPQTHLNLG